MTYSIQRERSKQTSFSFLTPHPPKNLRFEAPPPSPSLSICSLRVLHELARFSIPISISFFGSNPFGLCVCLDNAVNVNLSAIKRGSLTSA